MIVVVDASAIASTLIPEPQSKHAERLLSAQYELVAPDHLQVEIYSAVLRAIRRGRLSTTDAGEALTYFRTMPVTYVQSNQYLDAAFAVAQRRGGSVYDALYVVAAGAHATAVVTHDGRLADMARAEQVAVTMVAELPTR